jgi:hypothetical protein
MQQAVEAPTPQALADLLARCKEIGRYATQLTAAEESRIAALAAALLSMRHVLNLHPIAPEKLPLRQARIAHWALTDPHDAATVAPSLVDRRAALAIDEHEQVKVLSDRTWRGVWRTVTLWRDGVHGISAAALMQYLAHLTAVAQQRAPDVVTVLLERSEAVVAASSLIPTGPRTRVD